MPVLGLVVTCSLLVCILTPATVHAGFRSPFLNDRHDGLSLREGDPGDGVLAPETFASGRATSSESSYLASDGSLAAPGIESAAQGLWLPIPGLILHQVFFWGPSAPSPFLAGRSGNQTMTLFYGGMTEHPSGDVLYVLDERGCRYAP